MLLLNCTIKLFRISHAMMARMASNDSIDGTMASRCSEIVFILPRLKMTTSTKPAETEKNGPYVEKRVKKDVKTWPGNFFENSHARGSSRVRGALGDRTYVADDLIVSITRAFPHLTRCRERS